jgi:threonine aldolase
MRHPAPPVDLRSDTVTRPTPAMREAMMSAEVGDHVLGDDPTAAELESRVAELLGKEAALFFPSGIMANQTAVLALARRGTEVLVAEGAHILQYEEGAAAALAGAQLRPLQLSGGLPSPSAFAEAFNPGSRYLPETSLVCLENTLNSAGGRILPLELMARIGSLARGRGVPVHLDGARLANAAVAAGVEMRRWAEHADTVMISLSKGLGAPVGSMLAGPAPLMEQAWRIRRRLGGGMRQAGILAAAGLHALQNHLESLEQDHHLARSLARGVGRLPGLDVEPPETNIVMVDVDPATLSVPDLLDALEREGVRMTRFGPHRLRAVTHRDLDEADIERAIAVVEKVHGGLVRTPGQAEQ